MRESGVTGAGVGGGLGLCRSSESRLIIVLYLITVPIVLYGLSGSRYGVRAACQRSGCVRLDDRTIVPRCGIVKSPVQHYSRVLKTATLPHLPHLLYFHSIMLTLYFLNSSRAIRIAWILEELGLEYELVAADRAPNGQGPPDFKAQIPSPLAKSPTIKDGSVVVTESGAIIEYLCEKTSSPLLPNDPQQRADVRQWLHAAEGTFMLHASAILYARWNIAEEAKGTMADMEERMSKNVVNDMNWLEGVLAEQKKAGSGWIVGDKLTAADIQMQFRYVAFFVW